MVTDRYFDDGAMDGLDLARALRGRGASVPILLASDGDTLDVAPALFSGFLPKDSVSLAATRLCLH